MKNTDRRWPGAMRWRREIIEMTDTELLTWLESETVMELAGSHRGDRESPPSVAASELPGRRCAPAGRGLSS